VSGSAGRHSVPVAPRPRAARVWTAVAILSASVAVGAVLPAVLPVDPGWSPSAPVFRPAPDVRLIEPPRAEPMSASAPVELSIPVLNIRSEVEPLGLDGDGALEIPGGALDTGWYERSPTPGELGPAVLAAHVDWAGQPGIFRDIDELRTGDEVTVTREDGSVATFWVERVASYAKSEFPTDAVYGDLDHAGLRLITCGGEFDEDSGDYPDNVVVFARLTD
jgi:Sortase domain